MKAFKVIVYTLLGIFVLVIGLVALLTTVLLSSWGQTKILDYANTHIPGKINVKALNLSWFSGQEIEGFTLNGQDGKLIAKADKITFASPLFTLILTRDLSGSAAVKGLEASLELTSKGTFNLNDALGLPSPDLKAQGSFAPLHLKNVNVDIQLAGLVHDSKISVSGTTEQGTQQGSFELTGQGGKEPKLHLKALHFPVSILDQLAALKYPYYAGLYVLALGDYLDFTVAQSGTPTDARFDIALQAPNLSTNLQGTLREELFTLKTPVEINYTLNPSLFQRIKQIRPSRQYPNILQPIPLKLKLDAFALKLRDYRPNLFASTVVGTLSAGPVALDLANGQGHVDLTILSAQFATVADNPAVKLVVHSQGKHNDAPLNADIQVNVQKPKDGVISAEQILKALQVQARIQGLPFLGKVWDVKSDSTTLTTKTTGKVVVQAADLKLPEIKFSLDHANFDQMQALLTVDALPTAFFNRTSGGQDLQPLLGKELAVVATGTFGLDGKGRFKVDVKGQHIEGRAALAMDDRLHLQHGSDSPWLKMSLSPELWVQLHQQWMGVEEQKLPFKLAKTAVLTLSVPELNIDFANLTQGADLKAEMSLKDVALIDPVESKRLTLGDIKGQVQTQKTSQKIDWELNVNGLGEGSIQLTGALPSPFSPNAAYTLANLDFDLHMESQGIPIGIASRFAGFDPSWTRAVEAALGKRVEVKADIQLQKLTGPIKGSIKGENGFCELDGRAANGVLILNKPLTAQCTVTPEFGRDVFGLVLPLLDSALSADNPLQLQINPEGFAFPISPYDFHLIAFQKATFTLGKMRFNSQGDLGDVLSLLKVRGQDQFSVWFTPAYLSLKQSVLKIERFDMLVAEQYPMAVWGTVDFPKEWVNMEIGLTSRALAQALGVKGLDSGMLQVPLRGPVGNPSIDKNKVAAQISKIVVETRVPEGKLIGTILGVASTVLGGDNQPPPPTTQPLPWETSGKTGQDSAQDKDTEKKSKTKKVIDKVQKGVDSLFNSLIPK